MTAAARAAGAPRVSVIMNCLNGEKYLREAIDSVYAQSYPDWELVLWDNGSTDSTPAGSPTSWSRSATVAGTRKMPLPMVDPMSTATALQSPRCRGRRSPPSTRSPSVR